MNQIMSQLKKILSPFRGYLIPMAVTLVLALATYQVYALTKIQPSKQAVEEGRQKLKSGKIKFDAATLADLEQRVEIPSAPRVDNVGKSDPFSP